jgi:heme o synthase
MAITAARFYRNPSNSSAKGLFRASLLYLPVFMTGLMIHRTPERRLGATAAAVEREGESGGSSTAPDVEDPADSTVRSTAKRRPAFAPPFPLLPLPNRN